MVNQNLYLVGFDHIIWAHDGTPIELDHIDRLPESYEDVSLMADPGATNEEIVEEARNILNRLWAKFGYSMKDSVPVLIEKL